MRGHADWRLQRPEPEMGSAGAGTGGRGGGAWERRQEKRPPMRVTQTPCLWQSEGCIGHDLDTRCILVLRSAGQESGTFSTESGIWNFLYRVPLGVFISPAFPFLNILYNVLLDNTKPESPGKVGTVGMVSLATTPGDPAEATAGPDRLHNSRFNAVELPRRPRCQIQATFARRPFQKSRCLQTSGASVRK